MEDLKQQPEGLPEQFDEPAAKILIDVKLDRDKKEIYINTIEIDGNFAETATVLSQCIENAVEDIDSAIEFLEIALAETKERKKKGTPSIVKPVSESQA